MEKILAIVFLLLFIWVAIPHVERGEWLAPAAAPYDHWAFDYSVPGSRELLATPPLDYGWYRFDFWNTPSTAGRPVLQNDFRLRR